MHFSNPNIYAHFPGLLKDLMFQDLPKHKLTLHFVLLVGEEHIAKWKDVKVGDVVRVCDNELFPADLLCLDTGLADGVCFIRTTNLDGESNLKIRKSVDLRSISESYTLPGKAEPQV